MRILVTGASGFIGKHIVDYLLKNTQAEIICSSPSQLDAEPTPWYGKVSKYIPFDILSLNNDKEINLMEYFNHPDVLIYLTWLGLPNYFSDVHIEKNLVYGNLFLSNFINNGLKNILVTGTCLEYGMKEGELFEDDKCEPFTTYGIAKYAQYLYLKNIAEKNKVNYKWARLFYMYGEGQNPKSLYPQLIQTIESGETEFRMSKGDQQRDFLHINMVAEYLCKLALTDNHKGIFNCSSGNPMSVVDFVNKILKEKNASLKLETGYYDYPDYEPFSFWGNNTKLMNALKNYNHNAIQ